LRRVAEVAPDPPAALRRAQGMPAGWRPAATVAFVRRERARDGALAGGTRAHRRAHGRARAAGGLALVGLALIVVALVVGLGTLLPLS
jgi:hypothetical protein